MFDLNIDHYNKKELECLLNLSSSNYSKKDVEDSTHTLTSQVQMNTTISNDLKERTNSFLVKVKETLIGFIESKNYTSYQEMSLTENSNHFVISKTNDKINPIERNILFRVVNIDSQFRDNLENSNPSSFSINLTNRVTKAISIELTMFEPPAKILNISEKLRNNYFHIQDDNGLYKVAIKDGIYNNIDVIDLQGSSTKINTQNMENGLLKLTFTGLGSNPKAVFNLDYNGRPSNTPIVQRLGYMLGFRSDIIDITGNNIKATARPSFKTSNYFFLSINDFQQNSSSNFVSSSSNLVVPSTTLARISVSGSNDNNVIFSGEANNTSPERKYFGPCDIQRLEVNLMDKFGRHVDTGGTDYSFAITFKVAYD